MNISNFFNEIKSEPKENTNSFELKSILMYFLGYSIFGVLILTMIAASYIASSGVDITDVDLVMELTLEYVFKTQIFLDLFFLGMFIVIWRGTLSFKSLQDISIKKFITTTLIASMFLLVTNIVLGLVIESIVGSSSGANEEALAQMMDVAPYSLVFAAVIFAPIIEEIIFRGCIYNLVEKKTNSILAIIVSGAIFGFIHIMGGLMEGNMLELVYFIQYFIMGALFGFFYYKTKNIHFCIAIHMINNLIAVALMFLT